jgi:hypothetical protein
MNRYKYSTIVEGLDWSTRETYKAWLFANLGPRDLDWRFLWYEGQWYKVSFINKEDALAFGLRFKCQHWIIST